VLVNGRGEGHAISATDTAGEISLPLSAAASFQMFILENTSLKDHNKSLKVQYVRAGTTD